MLAFHRFQHMLLSVENTAFCRKNFKNSGKNSYNARVQAQKHRTSLTQTSVLSRQNIRTLWQRSPMFPLFRPEMAQKSPFSDFAIFRDKARRGDFRSPSQPVNDGGREGTDTGQTYAGKYCTLLSTTRNLWRSMIWRVYRFLLGIGAFSAHSSQWKQIKNVKSRVE